MIFDVELMFGFHLTVVIFRTEHRQTKFMKVNLPKLSSVFFLMLLPFFMTCAKITAPTDDEFPIYMNTLTTGFDIGVESSEQRRDWLTEVDGAMRMNYPSKQVWGSVFIVCGAVALESVSEDFSNYSTLVVDLKGRSRKESLMISIEDTMHSPGKIQFVNQIDTTWKTYYFSLQDFGLTDLKKLHVVCSFTFVGEDSQTVFFKNVRFLREQKVFSQSEVYLVFLEGFIVPGYQIGISKDTYSPEAKEVKLEVKNGEIILSYPKRNLWGSVFVYQRNCLSQDFTAYRKLAFEIFSEGANNSIRIGIRNCSNFPDDIKIQVQSNRWQRVEILLSDYPFTFIDKLTTIFSLTFVGEEAQTVRLRNIRYTN